MIDAQLISPQAHLELIGSLFKLMQNVSAAMSTDERFQRVVSHSHTLLPFALKIVSGSGGTINASASSVERLSLIAAAVLSLRAQSVSDALGDILRGVNRATNTHDIGASAVALFVQLQRAPLNVIAQTAKRLRKSALANRANDELNALVVGALTLLINIILNANGDGVVRVSSAGDFLHESPPRQFALVYARRRHIRRLHRVTTRLLTANKERIIQRRARALRLKDVFHQMTAKRKSDAKTQRRDDNGHGEDEETKGKPLHERETSNTRHRRRGYDVVFPLI